ncbi:MAG: PIN domain-containing protein [Gemmatimonadales bacterium]|nr:MAG: PIN domain-containing protein [Gemmatimonadales bacterium]
MKVYLDTNVILDVLASRKPFVSDSAAVLSLVESGRVEGFVAAHAVTTLFYLLRREVGAAKARSVLMDLFRVVEIVAVDQDRIYQAMAMDWEDFEDAVQASCAAKVEAEYLLTRDQGGFRGSPVPVLSPAEFVALHGRTVE